ncbi:FtsX-like permease family protein [Nocardioides sp.]|uniref:FtsX-like permease family protein n=1 Tax=Nocardioides sp. TaxID=35761 RepID=UPI0026036ED4|nr:FtsX-like permease family protein [Nocardioides sp.]
MSASAPRIRSRTLQGAWSRRGTLLPLMLLTAVVVAGVVAVVGFAAAAGTSRLLAVPLLLIGAVAVPATGRELASARRPEIALARLRGLEGGELFTLLALEPLLVLLAGAGLGTGAGVGVSALATRAWLDAPVTVPGWDVLSAVLVVLLVALAAVLLGMATALREPLVAQVRGSARPRTSTSAAVFGQVLVVVGAAVAIYRARVVDGTQSDLLVLAGPALVGLAAGHASLWLMARSARLAVRRTRRRGLPTYLASRRLARSADAAAPLRVLVAAGAVAGLAVTGAAQVSAWADETARLRAGAPLRIDLERGAGGDATSVLALTQRLDPEGQWLMGAVVVPGEGSVPARRAFVDVARAERVVGDFFEATSAARIGGLADRLTDASSAWAVPSTGTSIQVEVAGVSARADGTLRPRVDVEIADPAGQVLVAGIRLELLTSGAPVGSSIPVDCVAGCTVRSVTLSRTPGDRDLPFVLTRLQIGSTDLVEREWEPAEPATDAGPGGPVEVSDGLLAPASPGRLTALPARGEGPVPVLVTRTATWEGDPVLESPGGEDLPARVVARFPALPLVEADGVYADLPRAAAGAPPTVPAAEVMVLARADTPAALLAELREETRAEPRALEVVTADVREATGAAQAQAYLLMAAFCLLVALLALLTAVARQRPTWVRDVAALRAVGVTPATLRRSTLVEAGLLLVVTGVAVALGTWASVGLLLGRLGLVTVPEHAVDLRTAVAPLPLAVAAAVCAVLVVAVVVRGRAVDPARSSPGRLREEVR